jgi:hypothetical protein
VFFHLVVQQTTVDLEAVGGFRFVSFGFLQGLHNQSFFQFSNRFVKGQTEQIDLQFTRLAVSAIVAVFSLVGAVTIQAAQTSSSTAGPSHQNNVPAGTILPVILRTSLSFDKCMSGQILHGKIAQDVPLPNGSKIRKGSNIEGHVVEVSPAARGTGSKISIQFDKVYLTGQWIPIVTNLRAIAGFMTVLEAGVPEEAPSEGTPYDWLPTTQIGGDSVYGARGPVMSGEDASKVVGKSVADGVLARANAKEGTKCRGSVEGNDSPQALWVFSTDACGVYGIEHLNIAHAGRTAPAGTIVLASETPSLKLRNGDGLLLRVNAAIHD